MEKERSLKDAYSTLLSLFAPSSAPGKVRTYEATLRTIAPKVAANLSPCALLMESEGAVYAISAAVLLLGPKSPSSVTAQLAVR